MSEQTTPVEPAKSSKKLPSRLLLIAVALVVVTFGAKSFLWSRTHESTDNAQISGDVVLVSPLVQGTVVQILVADNAVVKKGDPIVKLDDSKLRANYQQAEAAVNSAVAEAQAAGVMVDYAAATTRAGEQIASAQLQEASANVNASQKTSAATQSAIRGAEASEHSSQTAVEAARYDLQFAESSVAQAIGNIESAKSDLAAAQAAVAQARAQLKSASSTNEQAKQSLNRTQNLYAEGAVSKNDLEMDQTTAATAFQAMQAASSQVEAAVAHAHQKESAVKIAITQLQQSRVGVSQANKKIRMAQDAQEVARAAVTSARTQSQAAAAQTNSVSSHEATTQGQVQSARAQNINVDRLRADQKQALARVEQAKAALEVARIDLSHAVINAPSNGRVSKRSIEIGSFVQVGTAMMYLIPSDSLFVNANFKETQVSKMHIGDDVEIEVDGLPKKPVHGKIDSFSSATGATFALLPPDNATGNFVKVVQRIPVKIKLDQSDISDQLRVGFSVNVSVAIK